MCGWGSWAAGIADVSSVMVLLPTTNNPNNKPCSPTICKKAVAMMVTMLLVHTRNTSSLLRVHHLYFSRNRCSLVSAARSSSGSGSGKGENIIFHQNIVKVPKKFVPFPFQYHQELEMHVETLTNMGIGIGRVNIPELPTADASPDDDDASIHLESSNKQRRQRSAVTRNSKQDEAEDIHMEFIHESANKGWVIMVPNVIPGEVVRVRIFRNHKSYSEADLVTIVKVSEHRITPKCSIFEVCGGCQYQHMPIDLQRQYKQQQVQQLLERAIHSDDNIKNIIPPVLPTMGTKEEYYYRSKITPHYDAPGAESRSIGAIGFNKKSQRAIVDVTHCAIATRAINSKLEIVRQELQEQALNGTLKRPNRGATLLLRQHGEDDETIAVTTNNNELVSTMVNNLKFSFVAGNFFQNNPSVLPLMVQSVVNGAVASSDKGIHMTHLIDCYCGSGLFCLSASNRFKICVGIEVNEKAIEEARCNAKLNNITNCAFVAASAEAIFESNEHVIPGRTNEEDDESTTKIDICVRDFPRQSTVVVLDPPRKGCSPEFLEQLYSFAPQRVVYMSCDPATQARDAKGLVANGFDIVSVQPFDLFPQTRHVESLIIFERRSS